MRSTIDDFKKFKRTGQPFACLTAYDYPTALIADKVGIPLLLVGDSLASVILGYENTSTVTMEEMLHHVKPVVRGSSHALVVADLPFLSYGITDGETLRNAGRMLQEGGAHAVKIEGGQEVCSTVHLITESGIPVMGHIGFTPQTASVSANPKSDTSSEGTMAMLMQDALELEKAGAFSVVLQRVPQEIAESITSALEIPTIGVGSGSKCDGQIVVTQDLLGFGSGFESRNVAPYSNLNKIFEDTFHAYQLDVQMRTFPPDA